jgi:hypothetical protein
VSQVTALSRSICWATVRLLGTIDQRDSGTALNTQVVTRLGATLAAVSTSMNGRLILQSGRCSFKGGAAVLLEKHATLHNAPRRVQLSRCCASVRPGKLRMCRRHHLAVVKIKAACAAGPGKLEGVRNVSRQVERQHWRRLEKIWRRDFQESACKIRRSA